MITEEPPVTVVMACYNTEASMDPAIKSILDQTFSNFKFIIIDDGSIDNTWHLLKKWKEQDSRIEIVKNSQNIGLSASLNRGIDMVASPYIARMDADDEAISTRLELQMAYMQEHPEVDILGTAVLTRRSHSMEPSGQIIMPLNHEDIISRIFRKTLVLHPTILIKTNVYKSIGTYDNAVRWAEDADLWYRIYDKVTWANLETPVLKYTVKPKLTKRIIYKNLKTKIINLKRRGLLLSYSHVIAMDVMNYSFITLKRLIYPR